MGRLDGFKYRIITKKLKKLGFILDRQGKGSHESWCPIDVLGGKKCVMLPKHSKDMCSGTLRSILKQAGIDVEVFLNA